MSHRSLIGLTVPRLHRKEKRERVLGRYGRTDRLAPTEAAHQPEIEGLDQIAADHLENDTALHTCNAAITPSSQEFRTERTCTVTELVRGLIVNVTKFLLES